MPELNWPTIGVCWALTTATTVVLFVVVKVVTRTLRKRRKLRKAGADRNVWSTVSDKSDVGQTVPLMEVTSSTQASRPNGSSSNRPTSHPTDRRKQDDVSRWCSEHGLPEGFVNTLREQGFESKSALDALRPDDLEGNPANVRLHTAAMKVQLRQVLNKLHGEPLHKKPTSCNRRNPDFGHSLSDSGMVSDTHSPTNSSDVFLPGLTSIDEVDSGGRRGPPRRGGGDRGGGGGGSGAGNGKGGQPTSTSSYTSHRTSSKVRNQQHFNGLLSDKGLWQMTDKLGFEWRHLATLLGITTQMQEQLMENHPHKVKNCIYEMLTTWRNNASGNKEQIKGKLHKALIAVERNDIAQLLLDEQTHGSDKNINSISSII